MLGLLFVLRLALRRTWIAGVALAALVATLGVWGESPLLDGISAVGVVVPLVLVATRLGLIATLACWHMRVLLQTATVPFEPGRWYFSNSLLFLVFAAVLLAYAFRVSLGAHRSQPPL